jgi:hypothetical protein
MINGKSLFWVMILTGYFFCNLAYADEIQDDYSKRIRAYRLDIIEKAHELKSTAITEQGLRKRKAIEIQYSGRIPSNMREEIYHAEDASKNAEKESNNLGKEIDSLNSEMIKYYKGKVPKRLKNEIQELKEFYRLEIKEAYEYIHDLYTGKN